ncbi:MAG: phage tail tape measure protein [Phascolarctobacterium sp.]
MAKTFAFTFNINCLLSRNVSSSFGMMKSKLGQVSSESEQLKNKLKILDEQLYSTSIDFGTYATKVNQTKNRLAELNAQSQKLNGLIGAQKSFKNAANSVVSFGTKVYMGATALSGIISTAANFEAAMSKVGAITNATEGDMAQLTKTARELGARTQYTATQSAEAMSYLGMAGWKTKEIIAGMPGLLSLAAAGGTDLARTADIVSDNLTAFGLSAEQSMRMADVYATVITNTNTNIEMLGDTMKYAAPVARAFGASMEETAALAGMMANAGIKASQAGTALRSGFLRLAGPPKMAQKAMDSLGMSLNDITAEQKEAAMVMKSLGIAMSDTSGPKKMSAILTELRNKTRDLGKEQKLAAMKSIFGTEAATGWIAVLDSSDGTFEKLVSQLERCDGAADKMAKRMQDNAKGAATRFQSAMESVAISLGSAVLPSIAGVTEKLAEYTGVIAQVAGEHPALISGIVEVGASIVGLIGAVKLISLGVAAYNVVVKLAAAHQLVWNAALSSNPIGLLIIGIGGLIAVGYQLYKNWDTISAGLSGMWGSVKNAASDCWNGIVGVASQAWNGVKTVVVTVGTFIKNAFLAYVNFWLNIPTYVGMAVGYIIGFASTLPQRIADIIDATAQAVGTFVTNAIDYGYMAYNGLIKWFYGLPGAISGAVDSTTEAGRIFVDKAGEWGKDAVNGLIAWFSDLPARLKDIASNAWKSAKSAISDGYESVKKKFQTGYDIGISEGAYGRDGYGQPIKQNAYGGIYPKGAFLTTFAEKSGESAIPHTPTARNVGLLEKTNEIMGRPIGGNTINAVFNPTINITGSESKSELKQVLEDEMAKFKRMLEDLQRNQRRTSYA